MIQVRDFTQFCKGYFGIPRGLYGAEIGVFSGINTESICLELKPTTLVAVDCWDPLGLGCFDGNDNGESEKNFLDTFRRLRKYPGVVIIKGWSVGVSKLFKDNMFDFGYVDGNHCLIQCTEDLEVWYPKVRNGGVFGGHDYNQEGVRLSVSKVFADKDVQIGRGEAGVDWWIVK